MSLPAEDPSWPVVELFGDVAEVPAVRMERSVPLGRYWRIRPLVFSLEPRCQGDRASQK